MRAPVEDTGGTGGDPEGTGGCTDIAMSAVNVSVQNEAGEPLWASVSTRVDGGEAAACMGWAPGEHDCYEQGGGTYLVTAQVGDAT